MQKDRGKKMKSVTKPVISCLTLLLLICTSFISTLAATPLNLVFFDLDASLPMSDERLDRITAILKQSNPDIIILAGVKSESELKMINTGLPGYSFAKTVNGKDKSSLLVFLAKNPPASFQAVTDLKYVIKDDIQLPVQKGFIHAVIDQDKYQLHILGADLKNRDKHPVYNQTDMRRYEARLLRHLATEIIKKNNQANIMVLANLNDTCGKSPVKEVYNRRFGIEKRLFDLRPLDKLQVSWTHFSPETDEYERIDYAIVSSPLIPEIDLEKTRIIDYEDWRKVSSHRPFIVSIDCLDRPLWTKEKIDTIFPNAIRTPASVSIPPEIGEKRKRGSQ